MADSQLRVLTMNCWGLKYVSKHRVQRLTAIGDKIAASSYDIVALQEVWVHSDYEYIKSKVSNILPYSKFFHSGALGAGLAFFSRFPIVGVEMRPYSLNGSPLDPLGGDWFVGKGAASIIVVHPLLGELEVFTTHMFAKGGEGAPDQLLAHRLVNAWELAKFTKQAAQLGRYVIAVGDYNSIPTSLAMSIVKGHAGLTDAWKHTHKDVPDEIPSSMPPAVALHTFGLTSDSPINSYSAGKKVDPKYPGKRIDFILYRQPIESFGSNSQTPALECKESNVVFTEHVPGHNYSYSDHFAVEAMFDILPGKNSQIPTPAQSPLLSTVGKASTGLSSSEIISMIQTLMGCYRHSRSTSRRRLTTFVVCLMVLGFIAGSSAFMPFFWFNPIFIVVTTALAWWATTMFYVGFVFGKWEAGKVTNTVEELELYLQGLKAAM